MVSYLICGVTSSGHLPSAGYVPIVHRYFHDLATARKETMGYIGYARDGATICKADGMRLSPVGDVSIHRMQQGKNKGQIIYVWKPFSESSRYRLYSDGRIGKKIYGESW